MEEEVEEEEEGLQGPRTLIVAIDRSNAAVQPLNFQAANNR